MNRQLFLNNIFRRINVLKECCGKILCLSNVFVLYNKNIVIDLSKVNPSWLNDIRPFLKEQVVAFLDFNNQKIITEDKQIYTIENLSDNELVILNTYFEQIVPMPLSESVRV